MTRASGSHDIFNMLLAWTVRRIWLISFTRYVWTVSSVVTDTAGASKREGTELTIVHPATETKIRNLPFVAANAVVDIVRSRKSRIVPALPERRLARFTYMKHKLRRLVWDAGRIGGFWETTTVMRFVVAGIDLTRTIGLFAVVNSSGTSLKLVPGKLLEMYDVAFSARFVQDLDEYSSQMAAKSALKKWGLLLMNCSDIFRKSLRRRLKWSFAQNSKQNSVQIV